MSYFVDEKDVKKRTPEEDVKIQELVKKWEDPKFIDHTLIIPINLINPESFCRYLTSNSDQILGRREDDV